MTLGSNPSVLDYDGYVSISGSYGTITRLNAKAVTGTGVTVLGAGDRNVVYLSEQGDYYGGTAGADRAFGYGGNDALYGRGGNDYLRGDAGDDYLSGGDGKDRLFGGDGDDELAGGSGNDKLYGDAGNDWLRGGDGNDRLYGYAGNDIINGGAGVDVAYYRGNADDFLVEIVGGSYRVTDLRAGSPDGVDVLGYVERLHFDDRNMGLERLFSQLTATVQGDTLFVSGPAAQADPAYRVGINPYGDFTNDYQPIVLDNSPIPLDVTVEGTRGDSFTTVDATGVTIGGVSVRGAIYAYLSPQNDFFSGDTLFGGGGGNIAYGYDGDDTLWGGRYNDELYGGAGDDILDGDNPFTSIFSTEFADDLLYGGTGNDILYGNIGNDRLFGEDGNDILEGGPGNDYLNGGSGLDVAVFWGNRADYDIQVQGGLVIVDGGENSLFGANTLEQIETLRFDDGDVDVASLIGVADLSIGGFVPGSTDFGPLDSPILHIA